MNKFKITFLVFFLSVSGIDAQEVKFDWSLGTLNIYGDVLNGEFNADCNILHFNWMLNKFSAGFNILDIYDFNNVNNNKITRYSVLPVRLAYVPVNYRNFLSLSVYGKTGWQITQNANDNRINHGFYGSIGIQFSVFNKMRFYYTPYVSLFSEYDTLKKLKIGLSVDLGIMLYAVSLGMKNNKEKEYNDRLEGR